MNPALGVAGPAVLAFEVTGIFDTGMFQYDNQFVVMALEVAQQFAGLGDAVTGIAGPGRRSLDRRRRSARRLEEQLGYPYRALDWQKQNASLFRRSSSRSSAMGLIIFFIMIVAAFNIVSTLTMVVTDKTREIGILQAMGLTAPAIARIFLVQGAVIGVVGTALGLVGGPGRRLRRWTGRGWIRIDPAVYFIDHLPVHVEPLDVLRGRRWRAWLIAVLATLYPSRSAAPARRRSRRSGTNERRPRGARSCGRSIAAATAARSTCSPGST